MIYQQMSIFDDILPKFKVNNKIRLIEFFGGIGSQAKALEILNVSFQHHRLVEWAYNSYCSYNAIHQKDFTDYSVGKTKEEMVARIRGTSTNYNEPLTDEQLNKKPIDWIKNAYNNCIATNNLINIMSVHAKDLGITEQNKYTYVCCYSFPCQDLSMAGNRKGMSVSQADGGTRSGLLWEVERILDECKELNCLPQVLLMENVPQVLDSVNVKDWRKWVHKLETLGYSNFADVLNAKDYGIPQNRRRCFMISVLGEWNYTMPIKLPLQYRLKDMLEKVVDEKYYLSQKMIDYVSASNDKWTGNNNGAIVNKDIGCTINTAPGQRRCDAANYIADDLPENTDLKKVEKVGFIEKGTGEHQSNQLFSENGLSPTLSASDYKEPIKVVTIGNAGNGHHSKDISSENGLMPTLTTGNHNNGQLIATNNKALNETIENKQLEDGDIIDAYNREIKKDVSTTITTRVSASNNTFIAIKNATEKGYLEAEEGDGIDISTRMENHRGTVQKGLAQTLTCVGGENVGVVVPTLAQKLCNELVEQGKVKEGDIVKHSFTNQIISGKKKAVEKQGEMITLTTRGDCLGVAVEYYGTYDKKESDTFRPTQESRIHENSDTARTLRTSDDACCVIEKVFTDTEKQLFTEDGNIKRYLDSDIVDKFEEGQMATTTYPNGYAHGPRTHNDSIALNTVDRPCVKNNLRIRKLTPCECLKLMGFNYTDYESLRNIQMSDAAIYHMAGDSIVTTVLVSLFSNLVNDDEKSHIDIINNYVKELANDGSQSI